MQNNIHILTAFVILWKLNAILQSFNSTVHKLVLLFRNMHARLKVRKKESGCPFVKESVSYGIIFYGPQHLAAMQLITAEICINSMYNRQLPKLSELVLILYLQAGRFVFSNGNTLWSSYWVTATIVAATIFDVCFRQSFQF